MKSRTKTTSNAGNRFLVQVFTAIVLMVGLMFSVNLMKVHAEEITSDSTELATASEVKHYDIRNDGGSWDGTHYTRDGAVVKNVFFCDGEFTYYLQNDGTPMTDRLTYHPDGIHVIYFDGQGHEVFSNFTNVKRSIAGDAVDDLCFFDVYGYMYVDVVTYDQAGTNLYYANAYGVMERSGWFQFSAALGGGSGYANADGTLMTNTYTYDASGNYVYIEGNGRLQGSTTGTVLNKNDTTPVTSDENTEVTMKSKKGIQGRDAIYTDQSLGVEHIAMNIFLNQFIVNKSSRDYYDLNGERFYNYVDFGGQRYYYDEATVYGYIDLVRKANAQGVAVTFILTTEYSDATADLVYPAARDASAHSNYYMLNGDSALYQAELAFLLQTFSKSDCHVDNWILGNEVNMPNHYNYCGTLDLNTNVGAYTDAYLKLYNTVQQYNPSAKTYINLDHCWTSDNNGTGIAGKTYLDTFVSTLNSRQSGVNWNLSYHLYAPILNPTRSFWDNSYLGYVVWATTQSYDTQYIDAYNLSVLTNYVKNTYGSDHRIILSEQGCDSTASESDQAAGIAYTFYAAQFNDMIDACIFLSYQDNPALADGYLLGLKRADGSAKESYEVFKNMDTANGTAYTDQYKTNIGINSWSDIIPGYSAKVTWQ